MDKLEKPLANKDTNTKAKSTSTTLLRREGHSLPIVSRLERTHTRQALLPPNRELLHEIRNTLLVESAPDTHDVADGGNSPALLDERLSAENRRIRSPLPRPRVQHETTWLTQLPRTMILPQNPSISLKYAKT